MREVRGPVPEEFDDEERTGVFKRPDLGADAGAEQKEAEPSRETFEYRDKKGRLLGRGEAVFAKEPIPIEQTHGGEVVRSKGKRLLSFIVSGEKEGARTEIDVIALANPHGVEVVVADEYLPNYFYSNSYDDGRGKAVVAPLRTPQDVGVMLHELGHASQYRDERFEDITPLYGVEKPEHQQRAKRHGRTEYRDIKETLDAVVAAVPEAAAALDGEIIAQLETLEERRTAAEKNLRTKKIEEARQREFRDDALQKLIVQAIENMFDRKAFDDAYVALRHDLEEGDITPEGLRLGMKELANMLEKAGFRFASGVQETDESPLINGQPLVPKAMFVHPDELRTFADAFTVDMYVDFSRLTIDYATKDEKMVLSLSLDGVRDMKGFATTLTLDVDQGEAERYLRSKESDDQTIAFHEKKVMQAREDMNGVVAAQRMLLEEIDVAGIMAVPTKMMERDATRRALLWLRKIRRDAGVDLFAAHEVAPEAALFEPRQEAPSCEASTAEGMRAGSQRKVETSVRDFLRKALKSYKADRFRVRPPDSGDEVGITPMPGSKRGKK